MQFDIEWRSLMGRQKDTDRSVLGERAYYVFTRAAMIVPPWNIFWWIVGALTYYPFMKKNDTSGDIALSWVWLAPITIPTLPVTWIRQRYQDRTQRKLGARLQRIADQLRMDLQEAGIIVQSCGIMFCQVCIKADFDLQRSVVAYQNAFARAIRNNPDIDPSLICANADPLFPLDIIWAKSVGIEEHAAEVIQHCALCGEVAYQQWIWARDPQALSDIVSSHGITRVLMPSGEYQNIHGTVCADCQALSYKQGQYPASCTD